MTRTIGTVAAQSISTGVDIMIIGNAANQGATLGTRAVTQRVRTYNYTQIFRSPYGFSETLAASKLYGGAEPEKERRKKAVEHKRQIELTLFTGPRDFDTTNVKGYCGGLYEFITTNVTLGTNLTESSFDDFLRTALHYGSKNKSAHCAPRVASILSAFMRDGWIRATPGESVFGAHVDSWVSSAYGWNLPMFVHRDWNEFGGAVSPGGEESIGATMFVADMEAVVLRPLRSTRLLTNRQANDADEITEEYLTELSFEVRSERKHALLQGVS